MISLLFFEGLILFVSLLSFMCGARIFLFCFVFKVPCFKKLCITHDLWSCLWEFRMNEVWLHLFRDCLHVLKRTLSVLEDFELTVCSYLEITHVVQIWAFMFLIPQLLLSNSDENLLFSIITQHQIKSRPIFVDRISSYSSACSVEHSN